MLDPGRGRTKTGYLWALARDDRSWGGDDPPGVVYFYAPGRSGENAEKFLTGFDGILKIDGYTGYNRLTRSSRKGSDPIRVAYCWAHARRKLKEVFDRDGSEIAADGRVEIDPNGVENLIRPIALGRKNALFAGHDEGGKAWGRIASLVATAKINSVEPFAYLKATLKAIANGHPKKRIDELLPCSFKPSSRNRRGGQLTLTEDHLPARDHQRQAENVPHRQKSYHRTSLPGRRPACTSFEQVKFR